MSHLVLLGREEKTGLHKVVSIAFLILNFDKICFWLRGYCYSGYQPKLFKALGKIRIALFKQSGVSGRWEGTFERALLIALFCLAVKTE